MRENLTKKRETSVIFRDAFLRSYKSGKCIRYVSNEMFVLIQFRLFYGEIMRTPLKDM